MKLDPEIKQLRKDNKKYLKVISELEEDIKGYKKMFKMLKSRFFYSFIEPSFSSEKLTPKYKKTLELIFKHGMTTEDIQGELQITRERLNSVEKEICDVYESLFKM